MPEIVGGMIPLNWRALVAEAVKRRKEEKMTQREHAALASVSVPTMIAFDRGELSLSLAKATDILRVVGLVEEVAEGTTQEAFVGEAFSRWRALTKELPKESPGRFKHGWYRVDYAIDGDLKDIELHKMPDLLRQAVVRHTGWPMFWIPGRPELAPREIDGSVECWLPPGDKDGFARAFSDPATCDFWRATPSGRMFLIRGYQEDGQETFPPGTLFDMTLPVWRMGEAFLHAARLAKLLARAPDETTIRMRFLFTGLQGRDLRNWASPLSTGFFTGERARSEEATLQGVAPVLDIEPNLAAHVQPLVSSLFERFSVSGISRDFIATELDRMRNNNFSP